MKEHLYNTPLEVAEAFAKDLLDITNNQSGAVHIALSGGSTPKLLFDIIAKKNDLNFDWDRIHLWWGDERMVAPTHEESNYKMTKDHLIDKVSIPEANIHRVLGENTPEDEAVRYGKEISDTLPIANGLPQFDLIILGMGADGHTASIFPQQIELFYNTNVCALAVHPESGQLRVTLTGDVINNAREVAFLVTGSSKTEKIQAIFSKADIAKTYPASLVAPIAGTLHWYLDEAAKG